MLTEIVIIQSVLDVKDDNPAPKGVTNLFNRSILILTPARALKFTAVTPERHYVWLTALSFLAHSSHDVPDVAPAPSSLFQATPLDFEMPMEEESLNRKPIRDSIRVAKGKTVVARSGPVSVRSLRQGSALETESMLLPEAPASPPNVPRYSTNSTYYTGPSQVHSRKRSNTGPRQAPPLSFRGFSTSSSHAHSSSTAGHSIGTNGSSDVYHSQPGSATAAAFNTMSLSGRSSIRTSDASARPGAVLNNFFDAVGTVRMEAFISPLSDSSARADDILSEHHDNANSIFHATRLPRRGLGSVRKRNRDSHHSVRRAPAIDDWYSGSKTAGEEEYDLSSRHPQSHDPFRGF